MIGDKIVVNPMALAQLTPKMVASVVMDGDFMRNQSQILAVSITVATKPNGVVIPPPRNDKKRCPNVADAPAWFIAFIPPQKKHAITPA